MNKKTPRRRLDVNVEELDRIIDGAMREPLNETDGQTLRTALHALVESLERRRNTEKTGAVLGEQNSGASTEAQPEAGRNGAQAFRGADKVEVSHGELKTGDRCPDCARGNVYEQKEPNWPRGHPWCGSWARRRGPPLS